MEYLDSLTNSLNKLIVLIIILIIVGIIDYFLIKHLIALIKRRWGG